MERKIILLIIAFTIALTTGCQSVFINPQNQKLFAAISSNNLQGLKEVVSSNDDLNFSDIGFTETTSFAPSGAEEDSRALAIALTDSGGCQTIDR